MAINDIESRSLTPLAHCLRSPSPPFQLKMGRLVDSDLPTTVSGPEPIAIVGIGCRFPGKANTPSKLWDLLCQPYDLAKEIPVTRFNLKKFYHPDGSHHGTCNVKKTYFLDEDVRYFDAGFFGIPPGGRLQFPSLFFSLSFRFFSFCRGNEGRYG